MAFGNYSNNKDANKPFEITTYTSYRMNNAESPVDKTAISFSMWKQMLRISIFPRKENTDEISFDMDNGITIYMNHSKARILANEIKNFLRDPSLYNGTSVPSGAGIITISNGAEFGSNNPVIVIRKLDEMGNVTSTIAYETKTDYYYAIRGYNGGANFTKDMETYRNLELEEMALVCEEYCKASTYAVAHTVRDSMRYDVDRIRTNVFAIADKLGVDTGRSSSRGSSFNNATNFFNNAGSSGYSTPAEAYVPATLDDID